MKKDIKIVRVELQTELYERFKKFAKEEYKNPTSLTREFIVNYVLNKGKNEKV